MPRQSWNIGCMYKTLFANSVTYMYVVVYTFCCTYAECIKLITNNSEIQLTNITTIATPITHITTNAAIVTTGIVTSSSVRVSVTTPTAVQITGSQMNISGGVCVCLCLCLCMHAYVCVYM